MCVVGDHRKAGKRVLVDYHTHPLGHRGGCYTGALLEEFIKGARARGLAEIGFSDHDEFSPGIDPVLAAAVAARFPSLQVRVGLEVSYRPGREQEIARLACSLPFDYLIGSVHEIGGWMFDHPDYQADYDTWDINELYRTYFNLIEKLAGSGLFDIVGHLDLVKVFGHRPAGATLPYACQALQAIKKSGITVEINSSGLCKPCAEIYPARELLQKCFDLDIPVTMGSDAHAAEEVGRDLTRARQLLKQAGYRRLMTFTGRLGRPQPL